MSKTKPKVFEATPSQLVTIDLPLSKVTPCWIAFKWEEGKAGKVWFKKTDIVWESIAINKSRLTLPKWLARSKLGTTDMVLSAMQLSVEDTLTAPGEIEV